MAPAIEVKYVNAKFMAVLPSIAAFGVRFQQTLSGDDRRARLWRVDHSARKDS